MITWILDQHVDRVRNAATPFIEAAHKRHHIVHGLRDSLLPKPIDLTGITISGPTIVRGSHGFVNYVQTELDPSPGGFTHPTNFQLSTYGTLMGEYCLNDGFHIIDYGVFDILKDRKTQPAWFVKPLEELKRFSGVVVKGNQSIEEAHIEKYGKWLRPRDSCRMAISLAKEIYKEYRVVVVDGKAITGSTYDMSDVAPTDVLEFVNEIDRMWKPAPVYVVDVATTANGFKIVEYNQFGTSAMYGCNQELIIDALENYVTSKTK
jgi:ATP-grasp domain, R2K clade family 3